MKKLEKLRSVALVLFCALLTLLTGQGRAEEGEQVESSAKAAVLLEKTTGAVLLRCNENTALPMASTTKVMTALLAIERGKLDDVVTVSRNAFGVPGTSIYLGEGERVTLRDLLYGLMLASGNDAAVAIAEHIGGDVDGFVRLMNQRAEALGCDHTVFQNPNGLPAPGHHTTAYELALIAREAMSHPFFRELVSTRRASIPWEGRSYDRILNNKNRLLSEYDGATGIKTGYTKAAGRCLVFGAKRDGLELIGVVLGCGDWFNEAKRLMDLGFERYELFEVYRAGETVRVLPVHEGTRETVCVRAASTLCAPVPKGALPVMEYDLPAHIDAGAELGQQVGEARMLLNGCTLASVPLVLGESLGKRDYPYEMGRMLRLWTAVGEELAQ